MSETKTPAGERCGALSRKTGYACRLPPFHGGPHVNGDSAWWFDGDAAAPAHPARPEQLGGEGVEAGLIAEAIGFVEEVTEYRFNIHDNDTDRDVLKRIENRAREIAKAHGYDGNGWTGPAIRARGPATAAPAAPASDVRLREALAEAAALVESARVLAVCFQARASERAFTEGHAAIVAALAPIPPSGVSTGETPEGAT